MSVLAFDVGTTHWKAGIMDELGRSLAVQRIPAPASRDDTGGCVYLPTDMKSSFFSLIKALPPDLLADVSQIALAGMAEAGLIIDRFNGESLSTILPWFDMRSLPLFEAKQFDPLFKDRYAVTGLPNSCKYSIYKLLALLEKTGAPPERLLWLGVVEYAAWLLTAKAATEPTLAARTYAYDLAAGGWDIPFLEALGLPRTIFPAIMPSGTPMGQVRDDIAAELGLPHGIPVCICGHDHVCAAYGVQALAQGRLFCSMGTAQVLLAQRQANVIGEKEQSSGLSYGPALNAGSQTVLGSIQSSGGSVTMLNALLYEEDGYSAMLSHAQQMPSEPSGLIYFPYLMGSGAPHFNRHARGGFLGLSPGTTKLQLLQSVYEGIAFESRLILDAFRLDTVEELYVCGGLCAHGRLLQILSDVLRLTVRVPDVGEGTLLGAARLAYESAGVRLPKPSDKQVFAPRPFVSNAYEDIYRNQYLPLQELLLGYYSAGRP